MSLFTRLSKNAKALCQLEPKQNLNYLLYQIGLRSGFYALTTPPLNINVLLGDEELKPNWFFSPPGKVQLLRVCNQCFENLIAEADEILQKKIRFFGGELHQLLLTPEKEPQHWTRYERRLIHSDFEDIKFVWEPARFNWAITLGKAYYLSGSEKYAAAFWQYFEEFSRSNPYNKGLNWTSAQEVALRLIALVVSGTLIKDSKYSNPQHLNALAISIADHASRIPQTVCYAKAQKNNHLISEAVGLYTAAIFLPNHPKADIWRKKGLQWFNQAIIDQIAEDGTYIQYSTNYHRLMLMLALWMQLLLDKDNLVLDDDVWNKLAAASEWLSLRLDRLSGQVPNLGHNDGSHFLPLSIASFQDYRPVVQAASRAFQAKAALGPGYWDDLCLWLDIPVRSQAAAVFSIKDRAEQLILGNEQDWASLRAAYYLSRPAHADQLQVDIWHQGINVALDPGTFQYNAPPPWENSLAATCVHNTLTLNDQDQMTRAGKFLWLDWAQSRVEDVSTDLVSAIHFGYRKIGVLHHRSLQKGQQPGWIITDELLPTRQPAPKVKAVLNWLLPDWPFETGSNRITLKSPVGKIMLAFELETGAASGSLDIFKAGKSVLTEQVEPILGWYSPTYGTKVPALSIQYTLFSQTPVKIRSIFYMPKQSG